jgi:hypothetical protein
MTQLKLPLEQKQLMFLVRYLTAFSVARLYSSDHRGRAVQDINRLRLLERWDRGLEFQ